MERNLKLIISSVHERQESINSLIGELRSHWGNEERVLNLFLGAPDYCLSHPMIINMLADFLQCIDDESILSDFDLVDIEKLYRLNLETLPNELSQYEDLSRYYAAVLDNQDKSSSVAEKGIKHADAILKNLNELR